ncbi:MAG: heme-binding protein, partial [Pseudomonadota bacterium]
MFSNNFKKIALAIGLLSGANSVFAEIIDICPNTPSKVAIYTKLKTALIAAQESANGGFGFEMWATVVNRDGVVCAVAYSG